MNVAWIALLQSRLLFSISGAHLSCLDPSWLCSWFVLVTSVLHPSVCCISFLPLIMVGCFTMVDHIFQKIFEKRCMRKIFDTMRIEHVVWLGVVFCSEFLSPMVIFSHNSDDFFFFNVTSSLSIPQKFVEFPCPHFTVTYFSMNIICCAGYSLNFLNIVTLIHI